LLRANWRYIAMFRLGRARVVPSRRSQWALLLLRTLLGTRSIRPHLVAPLLFGSLVARSLIPPLLPIIGLLIIPLLIPAGRRHGVTARLVSRALFLTILTIRPLILTEVARLISIAAVAAIATDIFRLT